MLFRQLNVVTYRADYFPEESTKNSRFQGVFLCVFCALLWLKKHII